MSHSFGSGRADAFTQVNTIKHTAPATNAASEKRLIHVVILFQAPRKLPGAAVGDARWASMYFSKERKAAAEMGNDNRVRQMLTVKATHAANSQHTVSPENFGAMSFRKAIDRPKAPPDNVKIALSNCSADEVSPCATYFFRSKYWASLIPDPGSSAIAAYLSRPAPTANVARARGRTPDAVRPRLRAWWPLASGPF
jgi:hypothetical protein